MYNHIFFTYKMWSEERNIWSRRRNNISSSYLSHEMQHYIIFETHFEVENVTGGVSLITQVTGVQEKYLNRYSTKNDVL